jgi:hypothetical protein
VKKREGTGNNDRQLIFAMGLVEIVDILGYLTQILVT